MTSLNDLLSNHKICCFEERLSEPVVYVNNTCYTLTDYLFHSYSIYHTELEIQSHYPGSIFEISINLDLQRLKNNTMTDIEAKTTRININQTPNQLLDEISRQVALSYHCNDVGHMLNILQDYSLYIDMLNNLELEHYEDTTELLFIEHDLPKEQGLHYLKLVNNQLKSINDSIIDFSWFIDVVGIKQNELKRLKNINIDII